MAMVKISKNLTALSLACMILIIIVYFLLVLVLAKEKDLEMEKASSELNDMLINKSISEVISLIGNSTQMAADLKQANDKLDYCSNEDFINMLAKGVSKSHVYSRNVFDCTEFSMTFVRIFNALGCSARIATGSLGGEWHDFAEINASWVPEGFLIVETTPCTRCVSNHSTNCCWDVSVGAGIVHDTWDYIPMCETEWNNTILGNCYAAVKGNFT